MSIYIHDTAIIDEGAKIGDKTKVWHWSHISSKVVIGEDCSFGQNVFVGHNVKIGNNCKVQNNVSIFDSVILEDHVFCGPSMVFTNVINPRAALEKKDEFKPTIVKKGATLGANSTIICGITLGMYCFVAAGAVVTKDVEPFALMAGVPATKIGWMNKKGERVTKQPKI
jgi:UDP-2-acetamido-3-amino-2,3-dideoxy-glucuronate N-acetyltransferase